MKTAIEIMRAVKRIGGRIEPAGDRLRTFLPPDCSPEIKDAIRQHKLELLNLLEARTKGLTDDCAPWLHTARQVLASEFDGADRCLVESLTIGLRNIPHPDCQRALDHLNSLRPKKEKKRKKGKQNP